MHNGSRTSLYPCGSWNSLFSFFSLGRAESGRAGPLRGLIMMLLFLIFINAGGNDLYLSCGRGVDVEGNEISGADGPEP